MPKQQTITKSSLIPTVLISGGAGFIGSHLAEYLLQNKSRVVVLDNFKTGKDIHVKHLLSDKNFALYDVDINEGIPSEIQSVDYIFHLAGLEEYFYSKDYLNLESLFTNSLGTKNLLDLAKKSSAKFLLASTIDIYQGRLSQVDLGKYFGSSGGEENRFSLLEAKRFAEAVVWEYFKRHNLDARIVRLPEVYGPRMDLSSSGFLGGYIKNVLDGSSIDIYGEGEEKEFYLYISDVISGLVKAQFSEGTSGDIYSLVPENPVSSLETAYLVRSLADSKLSIQFKKGLSEIREPLSIPESFNVKSIGWKPKVQLKEGVMKTLEFFDYSPNTNAFKPAKYLEQKLKKVESVPESIVSLQGVKISNLPKNDESERFFNNTFKETAENQIEPNNALPEKKIKNKFKFSLFNKSSKKSNIKDFSNKVRTDLGYFNAILGIVISALLVFIGVPSLSTYINIKKGYSSLNKVKQNIMSLDSANLSSDTLSAYNGFKNGKSSLKRIRWVFKIIGKDENYITYDKLLSSLMFFSKAGNLGSDALKPVESMLETLKPGSTLTLDATLFDRAKIGIVGARDYIRMAEADLVGIDNSLIPEKYKNYLDEYRGVLSQSQEFADSASVVMSGLPQLLGMEGEKKYIIWFQNSNEIRPTGGFIGSYATVSIDSGKIKNILIDDIYNPDGQIDVRNIKTTPPDPIKNYLDEEVLYLRNSNWDPDFTKSAKVFDDIYFKITGESVDGYIAVDLKFVESLLRVTGPVFLASYNEDINSENLDERAQYYSGFDYKEGSTDKKSFLTILGGKLLEKIFSLKKEDFPKLVTELGRSLEERHLQISLNNNQINSLLSGNKWDGSLVDTEGDYLYVVNANLGGTKSNYYVENKMTYEINSMTRDGLLRANLYLDYKNNAENDAWPGGPYTDYVRVLVKDGSKLTGAKIINNTGEETDIFKDVVVSKVGVYSSFETSFKLLPKESIRLVISYDLPQKASITKEGSSYSLYWQKQPGTGKDNYSFIFNPPFGSVTQNLSNNLQVDGTSIKSSGILIKDMEYYISFK
ncbi:MAG TPA: NAD-dependent epimerase/dehydratase family protein [bacterium]|nr:NAD-dependent epimerase/dehydratase family protein [bacterium]